MAELILVLLAGAVIVPECWGMARRKVRRDYELDLRRSRHRLGRRQW